MARNVERRMDNKMGGKMETFYYQATNEKTNQAIIIQAKNETEARHKVINSLDLSLNWTIKRAK